LSLSILIPFIDGWVVLYGFNRLTCWRSRETKRRRYGL